jgi:hypothetical protein
VEERARRIGNNEALFREVNERLQGLNEAFGTMTHDFDIACECGEARCLERFTVPIDLYERVRSDSALFLVVAGHELPDVESPVERHDGFVIVRKKAGLPQEIASDTNPRG